MAIITVVILTPNLLAMQQRLLGLANFRITISQLTWGTNTQQPSAEAEGPAQCKVLLLLADFPDLKRELLPVVQACWECSAVSY